MNVVGNCQRAVDGARETIATLAPDDLTRPTPCEGWDVRTLVNHMIGVCDAFTLLLQGGTLDARVAQANPDLAGDDPLGAYTRSAEAAMREWRAPGALERTVTMPLGEMPAAVTSRILVADQVIHTWDLARALGRHYTIDEDLAAESLQLLQGFYDPARRGPGFGFAAAVPCPEAAPVQDRLIALSGRAP